jgi:hypothetical protein
MEKLHSQILSKNFSKPLKFKLNHGMKVIIVGQEAQVFGEICDSIKKTKDGKVIWVQTVIFEVEGRTSKEVLLFCIILVQELYKTAKQISSDNVQARCILVLSDANACLSMTSGFNLFFRLWKNTSEMKPLEFVEKQIEENEGSVKDCLDYDENNFYLNLFKEMLKKENEDGIDSLNIDKATKIIADGPAVKRNHVLAYHIEKRRFQFHSNAMREATRRFIETNK